MNLTRKPTEETPDSEKAISVDELVNQLSLLQDNSEILEQLSTGASLSEKIQEQCQAPISASDQDLIQVIEITFNKIHDYPQISDSIITILKRLEIPVAQTALTDNSFLSNADHPVRVFLNSLIDICLNSDMPNQTLENKFGDVVRSITERFHTDSEVFQQASEELRSISRQQANAFARNTERITQTYEGRQHVRKAEEAVNKEIQRRIAPPEAPEIAIELVENGWRELLKLTYIKLGPDSQPWAEQLDTLDQLLLWVVSGEQNATGELQNIDFERDLETDSFVELIEQQLDNIFPGEYRHQNTVEKIRDALKGKRKVQMIPLDSSETLTAHNPNELQQELESANPELNRWFKRAKSLKVGDEFSYIDDDTGQRNIKLAWINDSKQHFVFVNNRGQKVLDYDLVDLARELSQGLTPANKDSEWPLVERSLYSTVQQAYEQLAYKSSHDELTGLLNRKECERELSSALVDAKNNHQNHCMLYIDIDQFSLVNNLYGHVTANLFYSRISHSG